MPPLVIRNQNSILQLQLTNVEILEWYQLISARLIQPAENDLITTAHFGNRVLTKFLSFIDITSLNAFSISARFRGRIFLMFNKLITLRNRKLLVIFSKQGCTMKMNCNQLFAEHKLYLKSPSYFRNVQQARNRVDKKKQKYRKQRYECHDLQWNSDFVSHKTRRCNCNAAQINCYYLYFI